MEQNQESLFVKARRSRNRGLLVLLLGLVLVFYSVSYVRVKEAFYKKLPETKAYVPDASLSTTTR